MLTTLSQRRFSETVDRLATTLESVDVRVTAYRVREKGKSTEHWHVMAAAIRLSGRSLEAVRERHARLGKLFGPAGTRHFILRLARFPVTAIPASPEGRIVAPVVADDGTVTLGLYTGSGPAAALTRARQRISPWDQAQPHPAFEYIYQLPEETQYEERVLATPGDFEELTRAYLELNPGAAPRGGNVYVELESPAWMDSPTVSGTSVRLRVTAPPSAGGMRAVIERRNRATGEVYQRVHVSVEPGKEGPYPRWEGRGEFEALAKEDLLLGCLTHPELGELDIFSEEVSRFLPLAGRNPLLACLERFWDLSVHLDVPLLQPGTKPPPRDTQTAQRAFQASVGYLLTLAGVPTIDLGKWDKLLAPDGKVELGTADLLGFHAESRVIVVGACTMNVPRQQDGDVLLNVVERLRDVVAPETGVRLVPVLFSGQRGEPATRHHLTQHGVQLVTHDDLETIRHLVETGHGRMIIAYLSGESATL